MNCFKEGEPKPTQERVPEQSSDNMSPEAHPKPAQEWHYDHEEIYCGEKYLGCARDQSDAHDIVAYANAALAAERGELVELHSLVKINEQLRAEREKLPETLYCDVHGTELQREACNHVRTCEQCLATERAEHNAVVGLAEDQHLMEIQQLREQLAAERERYDVMVEDQERVSYRLRAELAALVDALKEIATGHDGSVVVLAQRALARHSEQAVVKEQSE
jgi:hypothetical protein